MGVLSLPPAPLPLQPVSSISSNRNKGNSRKPSTSAKAEVSIEEARTRASGEVANGLGCSQGWGALQGVSAWPQEG